MSEISNKNEAVWTEIRYIIDDAMAKRDRSVTIHFSPDGGMSVSTYPWPDEKTLRAAYLDGKLSFNDYRTKLGLSPLKY